MKFQYEDVKVVFCDEISMVGSMKLAKINFRFQDIADGSKKQELYSLFKILGPNLANFLL
jgi:hypothetical protein